MLTQLFAVERNPQVNTVFEKIYRPSLHVHQQTHDAALTEVSGLLSLALVRVSSFFPVVTSFFFFLVNVVVLPPLLSS